MEIIPAIDLKGGRCVRLYQGDYSKETVFSNDPVAMARHWQSLGAPKLHIVDLDGALQGKPANLEVVKSIRQGVSLPLQFGGGLRRLNQIEEVLASGVERVTLGTTAVADRQLVKQACQQFGDAIIVSLDARGSYIAVRGWQERTGSLVLDLLAEMAELGVKRFIYTDIGRDGTLAGPNLAAIAEVKSHTSLPIIASGGISSIADLEKLSLLGVEGAIVGQALYTGAIDLKEALAALKTEKGHKKVRTHKFDPKRMDFLDSPQRAKEVDMDKIMSLLPLRPRQVVADIGCGTGFFTFPLAQHLPQGLVLALDISPDMLERVKNKVKQSGVANVEARLCQEMDFPVAPGSLDGVLLAFVLHEQEERVAFLQKVRDLLRPGGWVGVVEWVKKPMAEGPPLYERIDPEEGRKLAAQAGLKVVTEEGVGQSFYVLVLEN